MERDINSMCTFVITMRNQPGILMRCVQIFNRHGYAIESMNVSTIPGSQETSYMTIVTLRKTETTHRIIMQLKKLIDVIDVREKEAQE